MEIELTVTVVVVVEAAVVVMDAEWIAVAMLAGGERFIAATTGTRMLLT